MTYTNDALAAVQRLVVNVSQIERRHFRPKTNRRENVAEHSLSVGMLAWYLHSQVASATDLDKVIKYAMVHDFVEVNAGDVNTFADSEARAEKEVREGESLEKLAGEFEEFPDMIGLMRAYQLMSDDEARFVWTADKIQALVLGRTDEWRAYREMKITREMFEDKMAELLAKAVPELKGVFADVIEWSLETY